MSATVDVIVIGAGPAGYVAAIRCAQLGLKTVCIDDWVNRDKQASPGGTCLNVGCIPSKALIESSEHFEAVQHDYAQHGIKAKEVSLDLKTMLSRKDQVVKELTQGVAALFTANKIQFVHGRARLLANKQIEVREHGKDSVTTLSAQHIIIASGSSPTGFDKAAFDGNYVVDSTGALEFDQVPKRLGIIGAGVIALELGSVWRRLGSEVTLYKSSEGLLPGADAQVAQEALRQFEKQGLRFAMGAKITHCEIKNRKIELSYQTKNGEHTDKLDKLVIAIGRIPNTKNLFTEDSGIAVDNRGFVIVDEQCRTAVPGVFAIGDCVRGPMLAHKGSEEGIMVAELIAGHHATVDLDTVPLVIYTDPEIAWIGKTEKEAKNAGIEINVGTFPFNGNGRAKALAKTAGFIKVIADATTDRILGVHMIGAKSSELIMIAKLAMDFKASSEDLAMTMFAHPTLSETLHEAALSVSGRAIHAVQKKKREK